MKKKQEKEAQFNEIISENEERIKRICRYYHPNIEDQKDMFQEIALNIWKSLDGFNGNSKIGTWVYRVALNTALTYSGKSVRQMKLVINTEEVKLNQILLDEEDDKLLLEAQYERLQGELNLLSVIDKALITLMLEGLSMKEIADVIGITEPNVKVKIHRIKKQLSQKLTEQMLE